MSHVCSRCGTDLSRLRAPPDPLYRLPIVVCPTCRTASVRRQRLSRWHRREALGLPAALGAAAWRMLGVLVAVFLGAGGVVVIGQFAETAAFDRRPAVVLAPATEWYWAAGALAAYALLAGVGTLVMALLLRVTLGHLGLIRRSLVWIGGIAVMLWVVPNAELATRAHLTISPRFHRNGVSTTEPVRFVMEWGSGMPLVGLAIVGGAVLAWSPLVERFGTFTARQAWLSRLTQARRRHRRRRA